MDKYDLTDELDDAARRKWGDQNGIPECLESRAAAEIRRLRIENTKLWSFLYAVRNDITAMVVSHATPLV